MKPLAVDELFIKLAAPDIGDISADPGLNRFIVEYFGKQLPLKIPRQAGPVGANDFKSDELDLLARFVSD